MATGRPRKELDIKQFENLCGLQCTRDEICGWFDITDKTLNAWCKRTYGMPFSAVYEEKRGAGKISLRRMQWRLAERNASMAIFLGKQYLNQRDAVSADVTLSEAEDDPLTKALKEEAHGLERKAEEDT